MPLLKNESNSPSSPLAPSLFLANLSAPLLSDGFTGGGRDGRGEEEKKQMQKSPFTGRTFTSEKRKKKKTLLVPLFKVNGSVFPPLFKKKEGFSGGSETKIRKKVCGD